MFDLLWRTLRKNNVGLSGGERLPKERHASSRPQLEALEDRLMPTVLPGMVPPVAVPTPPPGGIPASASFSNLQAPPASSAHLIIVPVMQNAPATTINLDNVFAQQSGLQHEDGLQWSMLGNTNAALVKANLSEAELTLTYTPGKWGVSTITMSATDADGVSERESILALVEPWEYWELPPSLGSATQPPTTTAPPGIAMV
jgi:hypothetical protein